MRLVPLKSGDEMVADYEARLEACTRRVPLGALLLAAWIGLYALGTALILSYDTGADPNMSPRQAQDSGETYTVEP